MVGNFISTHRASIAVCLLLILLAIVIHPDFDVPDARARHGFAAAHFALPAAMATAFLLLIVFGISRPESSFTGNRTRACISLPLLC